MVGKTFFEEYSGNKSMRCLDMYGNRPEKDATVLIGVLVGMSCVFFTKSIKMEKSYYTKIFTGLLIGIPIILFMIFAYQRHWFGLLDSSPAAYSRQFYSRTRSDEL